MGGLHAKSMTSQRYRATYKMADMRYYGNVMTTTTWRLYVILHLQQYSRRLNLFFIYQLMNKRIALKRILKFTLKQLLHVSVQSPSSGSALFNLAKVTVVKINQLKYIGLVNLVVWLHILLGPCWFYVC